MSRAVVRTYEDVLIGALAAGPSALGTAIVRDLSRQALAERAAGLTDLDNGCLQPEWARLDEPRYRARIMVWDASRWQECVDHLKPHHTAINDALHAAGKAKVGWGALAKRLFNVMPVVVARGRAIVDRENPFPAVWPLVADELAAQLYRRNTPGLVDAEWRYLNALLLAGFFASCRLSRAQLVCEAMDAARETPLGPRGVFVRVPELISQDGIADRPVPLSKRFGGVALAQEKVSVLVAATAEESRKVPVGQGMLHEIMSVHGPSHVSLWEWGPAAASQLARARDAAFRLHEYTIIAYLALASVEQLLRAWAHHVGQVHLKPNGQPEGVLAWIGHLGCPSSLLEAVLELYDADRSNIRNRVMHGNLLEVEAKRVQAYQSVLGRSQTGTPSGPDDPFDPENVAQLCLHCLEEVDSGLATAGITLQPTDLAWCVNFALSRTEIDLGIAMPADFLEADAEKWYGLVSSYLSILYPGLRQIWAIGFVGWLEKPFRASLPRFMALAFGFEALYRLTVHLLGVEVLQRSHPRARAVLKNQYKMLDARTTGICTDAVLGRIIAHVPQPAKQTAQYTLRLAIKARNAVAHGAVTAFDDYTSDGLGHIPGLTHLNCWDSL